jgi:amino-acid N-acetyltransferase
VVAVAGGEGVIGCGSLKVYSQTLGEVAGLAVADGWQGAGVGRAIVAALVEDAQELGLQETFALTRKPAFFDRLGFERTEKTRFPLKVWADCARCPRQSCCDEIAVTKILQ